MDNTPFGKNVVVYDLEIKEQIDGSKVTWNDHHLMGISVGVAFDYMTGEFKVFMDDNIEELGKLLNRADIISGFNIINFDNKLLRANYPNVESWDDKSYDLLLESRRASGWKPNMTFPKGMTLDNHLEYTFGDAFKKTAHGSEAPDMWQKQQTGRLVSYCIADVHRECLLFEHVWAGNPVCTPLHASRILDRSRLSQAGLRGMHDPL